MRLIKPSRLREFWQEHARAKKSSENWWDLARKADWGNLLDVRRTFGPTDEVKVESGKSVLVFNIAGNKYRLICAIHYKHQKLFILRFLTHAEYSKDNWKETL